MLTEIKIIKREISHFLSRYIKNMTTMQDKNSIKNTKAPVLLKITILI